MVDLSFSRNAKLQWLYVRRYTVIKKRLRNGF